MALQRPRALRPGDTVRVVAPSGPFDVERFEAGVAWLRRRYDVCVGSEVYARHRYTAGPVDRRQTGLLEAMADAECKAIFCARGGYGAMHLLPYLRLDESAPQLLVGFSDITALHAAWQNAGRASIHGPVVTQLGSDTPASARLLDLLESTQPPDPVRGTDTIVGGTAHGVLLGGNLTLLAALVGTPYLPSLAGAVLLLEDVGERPYRVDRAWTQLRLAGHLDGLAGVVLGGFSRCVEPAGDHSVEEVLEDLVAATGVPCAAGFPIGHGEVNVPVPLGVDVELDATEAELRFLTAPTC